LALLVVVIAILALVARSVLTGDNVPEMQRVQHRYAQQDRRITLPATVSGPIHQFVDWHRCGSSGNASHPQPRRRRSAQGDRTEFTRRTARYFAAASAALTQLRRGALHGLTFPYKATSHDEAIDRWHISATSIAT